jgi:prepilin-type N-terminal cleavage/methylation domain-containing protein
MRQPMTSSRRQLSAGFTLIELAIAIIVMGLLLAAGSQAYSTYLKRQAVTVTKTNVETVASVVANYLSITGHYPCPASLTAKRGDPAYGHESTTSASDCTGSTLPPGVYTRISNRSPKIAYESGGLLLPPEYPVVRVGAIPFRELNLDESQAIDGYGDRIVYAVTERLATTQSYKQDGGGIDIQRAAGASLLGVPSSAHFFIYSPGLNRAGAYSRDGVPVSACPVNFPENLNCATTDPAAFSVVEAVTKPGAGYFDDVVNYFTQANTPLWQVSPNDITSIREKPDGKIGIFHPNDMRGSYKTIIPGTTHIAGNILADNMCDQSGNCFPASQIAGAWPGTGNIVADIATQKGIGCPAGQYMVSIDHGKANCRSEIWASCPPGKVVMGINPGSSGTLICDKPPSQCAATTVNLCGTDWSLDAAISGKSITVSSTFSKATYTCNNGTWKQTLLSGLCDCTAAITAHPSYSTPAPCGPGYGDGNQTYATFFSFSCDANGYTSTTNKATACVCNPAYVLIGRASCKPNPPFSGSYPTTQAGVCVNKVFTLGAVLPATQPSSCACAPTTTVSHPSCINGLTGTRTIQSVYSCPDGKKTDTDLTKPGDCTCVPTSSVTHQACQTGYIANPNGVEMTASFTCPNGANQPGVWGSYVQTGTDCIPAPPKQCVWSALSSGSSGQPVGIGPAAGATCTCGTQGSCSARQGANSYTNYPTCFCQ